MDWQLRARIYEWHTASLDSAVLRPFEGGLNAYVHEISARLPPGIVEELDLELGRRQLQTRLQRMGIHMTSASSLSAKPAAAVVAGQPKPVRIEHVRNIILAHAGAMRLESYIPGSATLATVLLFQHLQLAAASSSSGVGGGGGGGGGILGNRGGRLGLAVDASANAAMSAAYLSYAAALQRWRDHAAKNHSLLRTDALVTVNESK